MSLSSLPSLALSAAVLAAPASPPAAAPRPDPCTFAHPRDNPWFPLRPGTVTVFHGREGTTRYRERVVVTGRTRVIQGVRTTAVTDVLRRRDGSLAERTVDWYAADHTGRVWYFGEATGTYDRHGRLEDTEGSWLAGRDGAVAGTVMPAHPRPPAAYRQELLGGEAEDQAWVVQRLSRVRTPHATYPAALRTLEWSRLEPGVVSEKIYARGYGIVTERDLAGGDERFWLVSRHRRR